MCWKSKFTPELKIAKEPIPVKKVVKTTKDGIFSILYPMEWHLNVTYTEEIGEISIKDVYTIENGFHSSKTASLHLDYGIPHCWCGGKPILLMRNVNYVIMKAVIPKGAKYYKNEHDEYVSNKLVLCAG